MAGAGKTSLAVEYAHGMLDVAGLVWQFSAENSVVIESGFARLAALIGASGGILDPRDPVASVHAVLANYPSPWLLIFDDVEDGETVRPFLPATAEYS